MQTFSAEKEWLQSSKRILAWLLFTTLFVHSVGLAHAATVAGVSLKDSLKIGDTQLQLNGAGVRSKFMVDLYIAALYVSEKSHDPQLIMDADQPMLIQVHVISNLITQENLSRGTAEGFSKATGNNTEAIQPLIDEFLDGLKEKITIGDVFEFVYLPGKGVTMIKNRKLIKRLPFDLDFKRALFGIWLSDKPAQTSLRSRMLGKE